MAARTYHGSCLCGKVRFEVDLDLGAGTFKCNCTNCTKSRFWGAMVKPEAFRLLSGEDDLATYRGREDGVRHRFCRHCGVKPFAQGDIPELGGAVVAISLGALNDLSPEAWAAAPVRYMDGRHDNWMQAPAFTAHM
jgi:hypothetical protein